MLLKLHQLLGTTVDAAPGKEPPKEFRIFAFGTTETRKGAYVFDEKAAQDVLTAQKEHGADLALDYEHASLEDPPPSAGTPAAGWYDLELRADGLWAVNVKWTPRAADYLKNSEYRYFSPACAIDPKSRRVTRLVNIALTNLPATRGLDPLVAAKDDPTTPGPAGEGEPKMKTLLAQLGLKDTATEAEALQALTDRAGAHESIERELLTLTGAKDVTEARTQLGAMKAKAEGYESATVELQKLKATSLEQEVTTLVDGGVREAKIPPAMKEFWAGVGKKDVTALKTFLASAPKLVITTERKPGAGEQAGEVTLTDDDKATMKMLRLSEKDFLEFKKARATR